MAEYHEDWRERAEPTPFALFFGAESWPGKGYVTPTGQPLYRNLVLPVGYEPGNDEAMFCPPPEGESGRWIAVTINIADLTYALDFGKRHEFVNPDLGPLAPVEQTRKLIVERLREAGHGRYTKQGIEKAADFIESLPLEDLGSTDG